MERQHENTFVHELRRRTFELMFNAFESFPENNMLNWLIVVVETVQLTFYPLRRAVPSLASDVPHSSAASGCPAQSSSP